MKTARDIQAAFDRQLASDVEEHYRETETDVCGCCQHDVASYVFWVETVAASFFGWPSSYSMKRVGYVSEIKADYREEKWLLTVFEQDSEGDETGREFELWDDEVLWDPTIHGDDANEYEVFLWGELRMRVHRDDPRIQKGGV